jgi:hypothetical protein
LGEHGAHAHGGHASFRRRVTAMMHHAGVVHHSWGKHFPQSLNLVFLRYPEVLM